MGGDKNTVSTNMTEKEPDSTLNKEPSIDVTPNAPSNNNSTEELDKQPKISELKEAWEKWWGAFINHIKSIKAGDDNKILLNSRMNAQNKFMALYKEEKQSRENLANTSQEKDTSNQNSKMGGKSRKNKGKCKGKTKRNTKRKFRNVSSK